MLLAAFLALFASAEEVTIDGICYELNTEDGTATVTSVQDNSVVGAFVIKDSVTHNGISFQITGISGGALSECENITSVTIPSSITNVSGYIKFATSGKGVNNIFVDPENENYASVDGVLYTKDMSTLVRFPEAKTSANWSIPVGVKTIADRAFYECENLSEVKLPTSITTIESNAFHNCGITSLTIPASVEIIGDYIISDCKNLTDLYFEGVPTESGDSFTRNIPLKRVHFATLENLLSFTIKNDNPEYIEEIGDGLNYYGGNIFKDADIYVGDENVSKLTILEIPEGTESIGAVALFYLKSLKVLSIPGSVKWISTLQLTRCWDLEEIIIDESNPTYSVYDGALLDKGQTKLYFCPRNKTSYSIPPTVTHINRDAFWRCKELQSIEIPNSVTVIRQGSFADCKKLSSITIPNSVETIGYDAFGGVGAISLTLPESVKKCSSCFYGRYLQILSTYCIDYFINEHVWWSEKTVLGVPQEQISEYKAAYPKNHIIPNDIEYKFGFDASIDSYKVIPNRPTTVTLSLENVELIDGFQLDVRLPEGLTITEKDGAPSISLSKKSATDSHVISSSKIEDNCYRIVAYSTSNTPFKSGEDILQIEIVADEEFGTSSYIYIENVVISQIDDSEGYSPLVDFDIYVWPGHELIVDNDIEIEEDETMELNPTIYPEVHNSVSIKWTSSDPEVAYVDEQNVLHSLKPGVANITAETSSYSATAELKVTVTAALYGDANDNGSVAIDDVVTEVMYILEKDPQPFSFKKADVNRDKSVNIIDVSRTVSIILSDSPAQASIHRAAPRTNDNSVEILSVEEAKLANGLAKIKIHLHENIDITALQGDIHLPEGTHIAGVSLSDCQSGDHTVGHAELSDGSVRFALYSLSLAKANQNSTLLEIDLECDSSFKEGEVRINELYASDLNCQLHHISDVVDNISESSSIVDVSAETADETTYTLQGKRIEKPTVPGIYIRNGKKVVLR